MKQKFWSLCSGAAVAVLSILLVLTSSASAWGKLKYALACVLLGALVCHIGNRI